MNSIWFTGRQAIGLQRAHARRALWKRRPRCRRPTGLRTPGGVRHHQRMSLALQHALHTAPEDVRAALKWLLAHGFLLQESNGGPGESFGNVWLAFSGGGTLVEVTRDRRQWFLDIQPDWADRPLALEVLLLARGGWRPDGHPPLAVHLPEQLPPRVSWVEELADLLSWLKDPGSRAAVRAADALWQEETKRRYAGNETSD